MATKKKGAVKQTTQATRPATSPTRPQATHSDRLRRLLSAESLAKAASVFKGFSLSRFPNDSLPPNYVHPYKRDAALRHAERAKHNREFQNNKIEQHLHKLRTMAEHRPHKSGEKMIIRGITVALPSASIKKILPSYVEERRTVDLAEVMELIAKLTRGAEFYAKGDPTLNRLALLARIDKIKKALGIDQDHEKKGEKQ